MASNIPINKNVVGDIWGAIPQDVKSQLISGIFQQLLGLIGGLFKKKDPKSRNPFPEPVDIPVPDDIPAPAPKPAPVVPDKKFANTRLDLQWVNGTNAHNAEYLAGGAVGWGAYIRYDSNPIDSEGNKITLEEVLSLPTPEWSWEWDGENGGGPINKGGNALEESKGFACAFKIFKEGFEDTKRHKFTVWVTIAGKESNRITLDVD